MVRGLQHLLRAVVTGGPSRFNRRFLGSWSLARISSALPPSHHNLKIIFSKHVLVPQSSLLYGGTRRQEHSYSASESIEPERSEFRQSARNRLEEEIMNHIAPGDPLSVEEWQQLKTKLLDDFSFITEESVDGILMGVCSKFNLFQVGESLLQSIKKSGKQPNIATLSNYLKLCYVSRAGDMKTIIDICDKIRKEYPVMDSRTAERVIYGLAATTQWEEGIELLSTLSLSEPPSGGCFSALAAAAFDHGDLQKGWELVNQMLEIEKRPHPDVYKAWIRQCDRVRGQEASVMMGQLLNFWADHDIRPSFDVAEDVRRHFERDNYSWEGCFTELTPRGSCINCSTVLRAIKIQPTEFDALRRHFFDEVVVDSSIFLKTNPEELETFQQFVSRTAPYDVVIDGLNVAYMSGSRSQLNQSRNLVSVVKHFSRLSKKCLVLGRRHMQQWPQMHEVHERASVFLTQDQSQDDPFLLFAAMYSGPHTHFLSKDLMRSHVFLLKDPALKRVFKRWQQQRQLGVFWGQGGKVSIKAPVQYNPSVQQGPGSVWHIPYDQKFAVLPKQTFEPPKHWLCLQKVQDMESMASL